jgi:hypothetical protein
MSSEEAVDRARAALRQLAARALVREEAAAAELARLAPELARLPSPEPGDEGSELGTVRRELEAKVQALEAQVATARTDREEALAEEKSLLAAHREGERAATRAAFDAVLAPDPLDASPEAQHLARVREHAAALDAEASLTPERPAAARGKSEEELRAQLAALKAERLAKRSGGAANDDAPSGAPAGPKKRTL